MSPGLLDSGRARLPLVVRRRFNGPMSEEPSDRAVTELLRLGEADGRIDYDRLLPLVYEELRRMARGQLQGERGAHTLQPTALVHEAFLKLVGCDIGWQSRRHFFGAASESMRRILIDHARARGRQKRGSGARKPAIDPTDFAVLGDPDVLLTIDEVVTQIEQNDPRVAEIVKLRVFAGLSAAEIAALLCIHERSVRRDWLFARTLLHQALGRQA